MRPDYRHITSIAAYTATGRLDELSEAFEAGLDAGLTIREIREVLVQMYAYCGFPRSLRALDTLIAVLKEREARGIEDEVGPDATPLAPDRDRYAQGARVLEVLTRQPQDRPKRGYAEFSPTIDVFLKEHLFADIFGRDVLNYAEREVATIAALASMEGVEPMLRSHMAVGLNVGLTRDELHDIVSIVGASIGNARGDAAGELLEVVLAEYEERPPVQSRAVATEESQPAPHVFTRGNRVSNDNFTGDVWVEMLIAENDPYGFVIGNVTFPAAARTNWHRHPGGQVLLVTRGVGHYQEQGEAIQTLRPGDVVKIPPGAVHWHGASSDSEFSHIAAVPAAEEGRTEWLQPVTDEEYSGAATTKQE